MCRLMNVRKYLHATTIAGFSMWYAGGAGFLAIAQEEGADSQASADAGGIEEVRVVGYVEALKKALSVKREASSVVDVISAEDIGKFPDTNVAESLQRITGVAIDRNNGEGRFVSIRGLGPDFVRVTINGRTAPATGENNPVIEQRPVGRAFSFDQIQSEMVSRLDTYKNPAATISDGGLGGSVNIVTPRPLEIKSTRNISAFGAYEQLANEVMPRISGLFSHKFMDDRLGILISAAYYERQVREDNVDTTGWSERTFFAGAQNEVKGFYPQNLRAFLVDEERKRTNFNATVQYGVTESIRLTADFFYTRFDSDSLIPGFPIRTGVSAGAPVVAEINSDDTVTRFESTRSGARSDANDFDALKESFTYGFNIERLGERWTSSLDISYVENDSEDLRKRFATDPSVTTTFPFSYSLEGSLIPEATVAVDGVRNDPTNYQYTFIRRDSWASNDNEFQVKMDNRYELDLAFLPSIQFGVSYRRHKREVDFDRLQIGRGDVEAAVLAAFENDLASYAVAFPEKDFLDGVEDLQTFPNSWATWDIDSVFSYFLDQNRAALNDARFGAVAIEQPGNDFAVEEEHIAGWAQVNFEGNVGGSVPFRGNIGLRVVNTDQTSTGNFAPLLAFSQADETASRGPFSKVSVDNSYTEVLPSFNVTFDFREDIILRVGIGKLLSRPVLSALAPVEGSPAFNPSTATIVLGNPELKPITAWQADVAAEWYFSDDAILAFGLFWKRVDSFINLLTTPDSFVNPDGMIPVGTDINGVTGARVDVVRPVNEDGATITGFEVNFQNQFNGLPYPFDGLGALVNYTYVSSDAEFVNPGSGGVFDIPGLSKNTFNAVLFYEKGPFSGRIAFNHRDEFLEMVAGFGGNPEFVENFAQWDMSVSWQFNERFNVVFEGVNLSDEGSSKFSSTDERLRFANHTGRRFQAGVRYNF